MNNKQVAIKAAEAAIEHYKAENITAVRCEFDKILNVLNAEPDYTERCKIYKCIVDIIGEELKEHLTAEYNAVTIYKDMPIVEYPEIWEKDETTTPFNADICLPKSLADYLKAVQKSIQVYPEMLALPLLSALSACSLGKAVVSDGSLTTELCLYTMTVAPPSERKSSSIKAFTDDLFEFIDEENRRLLPKVTEQKADIKVIETRIKKFERAAKGTGSETAYKNDLIELEQKKADLIHMLPLAITDATTEAIMKEMELNGGRAYILSSESGVIDVMSGLYSNGKSNIDILLHGYSGEATKKLRAAGGLTEIKRPLMTIGTMAQPQKFQELMHNKRMSGQGLTSRFLFSFPQSLAGSLKPNGEPIPDAVKAEFRKIIRKLVKTPAVDDRKQTPVLTLDAEAHKVAVNYFEKLEAMKKAGGLFKNGEFSQEFGGKQYEKCLRIAGILHTAMNGTENTVINGDIMHKATLLSDWTIDQAKRIINDTATEGEAEHRQKDLLRKLRKKYTADATFSEKQIKASFRRGAYQNNSALLDEDLTDLASRSFLLEQPEPVYTVNRKRAKTFKMNPFIYEIDI